MHKKRSEPRNKNFRILSPSFFAATPAASSSIKDHVFRIKSASTLYWSSNRTILFVLLIILCATMHVLGIRSHLNVKYFWMFTMIAKSDLLNSTKSKVKDWESLS